jgi:mannose-6-phosphate isomerase-like protein (cupin superfamily)
MQVNAQSTKEGDVANDSASIKLIRIVNLPSTDTNYVSVLEPPLSRKLHSGFVSLARGRAGEEHSTEAYEEMIVILSGQAVLHSGNTDDTLTTGRVAYIAPHTKHQMRNSGTTPLKYLYIVTKVE